MNIKTSGKPLDFFKLVFGFDKSEKKSLIGYALFPTISLWLIGFAISIIYYIIKDGIYFDIMFKSIGFGALVGFGFALLALIAQSDWDRQYGFKIWIRIVIYNIIVFSISMGIHNNIGMTKIIEPVKSMQFVKTDTRDCTYAIKLKSDNMDYTYCESLGSSFDRARDGAKDLRVNLIGYYKYGTYIADNVEFIEKSITLK